MAAENANPQRAPEIPRPGAVFDPVARALDWVGDKWTLVLVRHLLAGPQGFQELRKRTGIAPRVLSNRLRQLAEFGFVEQVEGEGARPVYGVTARGRTLEPIIASVARWYIHHAIEELALDMRAFTETSPVSIVESLPFLLREERARGVRLVFEIRLTGEGGGVYTIEIDDGHCRTREGFATRADVRYTADARIWCGVALGFLDARDAAKRGLLAKEGGREAMDHYFHQVALPGIRLRGGERVAAHLRAGRRRRLPMISFGLTDEQEVVRDAMRDFAAEVLRPAARDADEASALPQDVLDAVWELGLTSTQLPESVGGGGEVRSPTTNALILEELACGDPALAIAATAPSLVAFAIADHGTEAQKAEHLPRFCGAKFAAATLALMEPSPVFGPGPARDHRRGEGRGATS